MSSGNKWPLAMYSNANRMKIKVDTSSTQKASKAMLNDIAILTGGTVISEVGTDPKVTALVYVAARAPDADAALFRLLEPLREVLSTMAAVIVEPASVTLPLVGARLDEDGMVAAPAVASAIQSALQALADAVLARRTRLAGRPVPAKAVAGTVIAEQLLIGADRKSVV